MQPIVELYVNSDKEGGAEPLNCNVNISLTQEKDVIFGVGEVVEKVNSIITYQKRKRLKKTQLCYLPKNDTEITKEDIDSPLHGLGTTSFDQPVEFESRKPCCYGSMSEKRVTAEDRISVEVVGTNKLLEEDLDCASGFRGTSSNNDDKVLIEKSNENASENCDTCTLPDSGTGNVVELKIVPNEAAKNDEFLSLDSDDAYCSDVPLHKNDKGSCFTVSSNATIVNTNSCDADPLANNLQEEVHDEARKTVGNVEAQNTELKDGKNIGNIPRVSFGDALGRESLLYPEEQYVASDADISLKQLNSLKGVTSQVGNECVNLIVDRTFAGYTEKKLLVLDVNGLLVDISSYVPYDYDPDDIIMKKAVFKRPYCDDFLKFCFERFNVGVWTSRTRRNMEPILDYLLGNDKCKLRFRWDQSHCTSTGFTTVEKRHKPLLLKRLKKLWEKCEPDLPWELGVYNESNTLLLDDTPSKALSNPRYNAVFPYTYHFRNVRDESLGPGGDLRVYLEGLAMAENVQEYVKQNPFGQRPITEKNLSWGFYLKVIEGSSTPPRKVEEDC